jgi:hypothetical protein
MATTRRRGHGLGWKKGRGTAPRLLREVMAPVRRLPTERYWWDNGWWGDQGETSECTIYSWLHLIHDGPVIPVDVMPTAKKPLADPATLYQEGQKLDGTPITDVESGLTCDSAAKVMRAHGFVGEWRWAESVDEVIQWVLTTGPCAIGANWYYDMFEPKKDGTVSMTGGMAGGHQWVINGASMKKKRFRDKNSWNRTWGLSGRFITTFDQVAQMLQEGAEVCMYRELPIKF